MATLFLAGCGGGGTGTGSGSGGTQGTNLKVAIDWPQRSRNIAAPSSAMSAVVAVYPDNTFTGTPTKEYTINRDSTQPNAYTQTFTASDTIPTGQTPLQITFFAGSNGSGATVAVAATVATIASDGTGAVFTLDANAMTVKSVTVPAQEVGLTTSFYTGKYLDFTALDSSGAVVAVTPGSETWSLTTLSEGLLSFVSGKALGSALGTVQVVATVDGVTSAPATITVKVPPGTAAGQTMVNPKDGATMVWVPAGTATIGRAYQTFPNADEQPAHNVAFDGYWIYKTEVSVAQYSQYQAPRAQPTWSGNTYPLVNVRWAEATQYASWAGAELPTEAQWEHAGRGAGNYLYPWGNDWNDGYAVLWQNTNVPTGAVPCGSTATDASGYGVLDMGGNVNEWCRDYYSNTAYSYATSLDSDTPANVTPTDNLGNDATITGNRVIRGGAYKNAFFPETDARLVNRMFGRSANYADVAGYYGYNDEVGFRCVVMPAM